MTSNKSKSKRVLSPKEAAVKLKVAPNLIYQAIRNGQLKAEKNGWNVWITPKELDTFRRKPASRPSARRHAPQEDSVGERLRTLREEYIPARLDRPFTQVELGERFKVSQSTIKNLELNLRRISPELLLRYAEVFDVSVDWILTGRD